MAMPLAQTYSWPFDTEPRHCNVVQHLKDVKMCRYFDRKGRVSEIVLSCLRQKSLGTEKYHAYAVGVVKIDGSRKDMTIKEIDRLRSTGAYSKIYIFAYLRVDS